MRENDKKATPLPDATVNEEMILKITKEITVKFIEVGRITPAGFAPAFSAIYQAIATTVRGGKP